MNAKSTTRKLTWCLVLLALAFSSVAGARNAVGTGRRQLSGSFDITPLDDTTNLDDISERSIDVPSPVQEEDLDVEKGPSVCKVSPELASSYPECDVSADGFTQDASTQTCGQSTIIPANKIGTCKDAQATLDAHNAVRARRGAAPLLWSKTLADSAQKVADTCVFQHSNTQYGENLAIGTTLSCNRAATLWIDEESLYPPGGSPGFSSATGHFTQVVWKSTLQVGCGIRSCGNRNFVVCQYYPAGNYIGSFASQVGQNGEPSPCASTPPAPTPPPPTPPAPTPPPPTPPPPRPAPVPPRQCCFFWFCFRC